MFTFKRKSVGKTFFQLFSSRFIAFPFLANRLITTKPEVWFNTKERIIYYCHVMDRLTSENGMLWGVSLWQSWVFLYLSDVELKKCYLLYSGRFIAEICCLETLVFRKQFLFVSISDIFLMLTFWNYLHQLTVIHPNAWLK